MTGTPLDLTDIFVSARLAQKEWAQSTFSERKVYIDKMRDYIVENADTLVDILCKDTGKTKIDALADEVLPCAFACKWYANNAESVLRTRKLKPSIPLLMNKRNAIARMPLGVVGIISPWNYPLSIPFGEVVMGLIAGNAILLKTSHEITPNVGPLIKKIVESSGLPKNLFHLLEKPGAELADAFFANGIDKIFFTGSVRVGKELMRKASETLTPLSLELGGNDAMIVLEDADLERATNGATWGAFQNAGQTCAGIERAYVHEQIYDEFIELLTKKTKALRHGSFQDPDIEVGAITNPKQLEIIDAHVKEAVEKGAKIIAQSTGKESLTGNYFPATVLVHVDHSMKVMKEETFGPVLSVMKVRTAREAVNLANHSKYALTSSIWTRDIKRAKEIALYLETGVTTINDHSITHALSETPWGGWKESGLGRTHGAAGLEEMTHCKVISWDLLPSNRNLYWYPFNQETYEGLKTALRLSFPKSPRDFLQDLKALLPFAFRKMFKKWDV